jgi:hypothetical protein
MDDGWEPSRLIVGCVTPIFLCYAAAKLCASRKPWFVELDKSDCQE